METRLTRMLEDTRREASAARVRGDLSEARYLEGKADGIADVMSAAGMLPIPWKPRPRIAVDLASELQPCPCRHT